MDLIIKGKTDDDDDQSPKSVSNLICLFEERAKGGEQNIITRIVESPSTWESPTRKLIQQFENGEIIGGLDEDNLEMQETKTHVAASLSADEEQEEWGSPAEGLISPQPQVGVVHDSKQEFTALEPHLDSLGSPQALHPLPGRSRPRPQGSMPPFLRKG